MSDDIKDICDRLLEESAPPLGSGGALIDHARRVHRRRQAGFTVMGAGFAVVAVTVAVAAIPHFGGPATGTGNGLEFGAPAASTAPASPSPSVTGSAPSLDLGTKVRDVKVSQVVSEMVAKAGQVQPLAVRDDQYLYVRAEVRGSGGAILHEMWLDPRGMIAMNITASDSGPGSGSEPSNPVAASKLAGQPSDGPHPPSAGKPGGGLNTPAVGQPSGGPHASADDSAEAARQRFQTEGPSLDSPSPQWLATLPTDPDRLLSMVDKLNAGTKLGGEAYEFKSIAELFGECGAVLTPQVRAAFYTALGKINGVTATELRVDGRKLYALRERLTGKSAGQELLLDPATGQIVGTRWIDARNHASPTNLEFWRYVAVAEVGQTS